MPTEEIYIAYSKEQDECTLNNRWFIHYQDAFRWAIEVENNYGCVLQIIAVPCGIDELYDGRAQGQ